MDVGMGGITDSLPAAGDIAEVPGAASGVPPAVWITVGMFAIWVVVMIAAVVADWRINRSRSRDD